MCISKFAKQVCQNFKTLYIDIMNSKNILKIIAGGFFALGSVGAFLPLLPTVPFWILAAIIYLKSDPQMAHKIFAHKTFGKMVEDFVVHGIIRPKSKKIALFGLFIVGAVTCFFTYKIIWLLIIQIAAMTGGAYFVATRREE